MPRLYLASHRPTSANTLLIFESKVGLKVFDRTTRRLMLTPFGTALLPYINDMLDRNEQLNNFIADYKHEKTWSGHHLRPNRHNYLFIQNM